jgi:hypothetical protein
MPERKSDMSVDTGFEDGDSPNVRECLDSHSQPFTDTDIIELEQQRTYNKKKEIASEGEGCVSKKILIKELEQIFQNFETVKFVFRSKCGEKHDNELSPRKRN